jgi:hypothetical protein|tara:strand:- start:195 stop:461 length:267 start_codon:yes stop_codon:yes gene_type:complete
LAKFSKSEVGRIRDYVNGRKPDDWPRIQQQAAEYLLMTHYSMTLNKVRQLDPQDANQLLVWATVMQQHDKPEQRDSIYLGYDNIPPLE